MLHQAWYQNVCYHPLQNKAFPRLINSLSKVDRSLRMTEAWLCATEVLVALHSKKFTQYLKGGKLQFMAYLL